MKHIIGKQSDKQTWKWLLEQSRGQYVRMVVLIVLEPRLMVIFLCGGICLFGASQFFRQRLKYLHKEVQEREGKVRSFLQEAVENILFVKVFGIESKMVDQNKENQQEHFQVRMKRRRVSILANAGFSFVFQLGYLLAMLWGALAIYAVDSLYIRDCNHCKTMYNVIRSYLG